MTQLISRVLLDPITVEVAKAFDCPFDGTSTFTPWPSPPLPTTWGLGVVVGGSGTGKSTLLRSLGEIARPVWDPERSIASHFASAQEAMLRLSAAGLSSIPDWCKPYQVLSTGQQFRANLARSLNDGACVDEFTSTVDRDVAKAASVAVARLVRTRGLQRLVFATCHRDIVPWLEPDWVFDTDTGRFLDRGLERRPPLVADLRAGGRELWPRFAPHHYMNGTVNNSSKVYTLWLEDRPVGLCAAMPMPGKIKHAWRGHRTVVLPEFQGLGLGGRMVEAVGDLLRAEGKRFFCRTAHPWVGAHRDASPRWRATSTSRVRRVAWRNRPSDKPAWWKLDADRVCWSHEYIGNEEALLGEPAAPGPRVRRPPLGLQGEQGRKLLAQMAGGAPVGRLAGEHGLRAAALYRLRSWDALGRP